MFSASSCVSRLRRHFGAGVKSIPAVYPFFGGCAIHARQVARECAEVCAGCVEGVHVVCAGCAWRVRAVCMGFARGVWLNRKGKEQKKQRVRK